MQIAAELSLYPLSDQYIPPIRDFIARLNARPGISVVTNSMSTQVGGEFDVVFEALGAEIKSSLAGASRAVFVIKVLGGGD
jgi:uncharacterized protein YqgV (UPF0045/DUF77 family)